MFKYLNNSNDKAIEDFIKPYLMPLRFNGEESARNRIFVPQVVVELKDRYDDMVEDLLAEETNWNKYNEGMDLFKEYLMDMWD